MEIVTDNDRSFCEKLMKQLFELLEVKYLPTTVSHPDANTPVDSFHRVISKELQRYGLQGKTETNAKETLQLILYGYRATLHITLKDTPAYLLFRLDPRLESPHMLVRICDEHRQRVVVLNATREDLIHRTTLQQLRQMDRMKGG